VGSDPGPPGLRELRPPTPPRRPEMGWGGGVAPGLGWRACTEGHLSGDARPSAMSQVEAGRVDPLG
jgi:hypothetical protein